MELRKVVAFIRNSSLPEVEEELRKLGIKGISVFQVKGYGEYANFSKKDWMVTSTKIEIFTELSHVEPIVKTILETASHGLEGDGIVAVLPVEKMYRIRTKAEVDPQSFVWPD
jgi:nitrogen regulatory protein P-II 1